ncbi:hypothetical protein [Kordia antarctica]|nr:hypothetical protein [Kordia antarctica]
MVENVVNEIPQGTFTYELYFSEFGGRMKNGTCTVTISGNKIVVRQKKGEEKLTDENLLTEGILMKHKSGKWIIGDIETDAQIDEFGGCTGGPIPIDFGKKVIEWC